MHEQKRVTRPIKLPHVAMVCARYLPYIGGVETHEHEVITRMLARGCSVTILTTDVSGRLPEIGRREQLTIRRFPAHPRHGDLYLSPLLARAVGEGDYDLVHIQGGHTLLAPMVLASAQRAGLPNAVTFHTGGHSSRLRTRVRDAQWRALRPLLRKCDALIAVSASEAQLFSRSLGVEIESIRVIRNGSEPLPVAGTTDISGNPLVCSIGRLERYKGHHRLIKAMPALLAIAPNAHLAVVGRGGYESKLRRLAVELGVDAAVTFISYGPDERGAMGALVRACQVVALLSDYEAHQVAVLEALGLGKSVVVASSPGLDELAAEGLATSVTLDARPEVLAQTLVEAAVRAPAAIPAIPTWDQCVDTTLDVYAEIDARRTTTGIALTKGPIGGAELENGAGPNPPRFGEVVGASPSSGAPIPPRTYKPIEIPLGAQHRWPTRRIHRRGMRSG